jgi:hypothetical protein
MWSEAIEAWTQSANARMKLAAIGQNLGFMSALLL